MIYCASRKAAESLNELFEIKHKVTLYLKKSDMDEIKKQTSKMADYKQSNFSNN